MPCIRTVCTLFCICGEDAALLHALNYLPFRASNYSAMPPFRTDRLSRTPTGLISADYLPATYNPSTLLCSQKLAITNGPWFLQGNVQSWPQPSTIFASSVHYSLPDVLNDSLSSIHHFMLSSCPPSVTSMLPGRSLWCSIYVVPGCIRPFEIPACSNSTPWSYLLSTDQQRQG